MEAPAEGSDRGSARMQKGLLTKRPLRTHLSDYIHRERRVGKALSSSEHIRRIISNAESRKVGGASICYSFFVPRVPNFGRAGVDRALFL